MNPSEKKVTKPIVRKAAPKALTCTCNPNTEKELKELQLKYVALEMKLEELMTKIKVGKPAIASINKLEVWYDTETPKPEETSNLRLNFADKLRSMSNAVKILPPNLVDENGRQLASNVAAICGFAVTDEMMEAVYGDQNES